MTISFGGTVTLNSNGITIDDGTVRNSSKHSRWANTGRVGRPVGTTRKRLRNQKTEHVVRRVANSNNST